MKKCENNGCKNYIEIPSLDCPSQCLSCAIKARERVEAGMKAVAKAKKNG